MKLFPNTKLKEFYRLSLGKFLGEVQLVPEGVWLQLELEKGRAKLERFGLEGDSHDLKPISEEILEPGQTLLQPCEFLRLSALEELEGQAVFFCIPALYFTKKFNALNGLGQPHSEVAYFKAYYAALHPELGRRSLDVLDIGCGRGRNAVCFAAEEGYRVFGFDRNEDSLTAYRQMAEEEGLQTRLQCQSVDLNTWRGAAAHDFLMAIVSLQFLEDAAARELLLHCSSQARLGALYLMVFPVASEHPDLRWPQGFHFLPQSGEVKQIFIKEGWSILEYRENYGHLGARGENGLPIRGRFATFIGQKTR